MGISQEEVQFGVVPGLADLAKTLAAAFGRSKERDFQTRLRDQKLAAGARADAAKGLSAGSKKADQLANRTKRNTVPKGPGKIPKGKLDKREDEITFDPGVVRELLGQDEVLTMLPDQEGSTPEEQLIATLDKAQRGADLTDDEQFSLNSISEVTGMQESLNKLQSSMEKKGDIGAPVVRGAEFMREQLREGQLNPTQANTRFQGPDGQQLPSMNQLIQWGANATDPANVAESQETIQRLMGMTNLTPTDQERLEELQRVTAPAEFDEMHEIEAAFSQVDALQQQWVQNQQILSQRPSDIITQMSGKELSSEESSHLNKTIAEIDSVLSEANQGNLQQEVQQQVEVRRKMAEEIKNGGNTVSGMSKVFGAQAGRAVRNKNMAEVWPAGKAFNPEFADQEVSRFRSQAIKNGMTGAQAEFIGQAQTVTRLPVGLVTKMAAMDKASADVFLTKLEKGIQGSRASDNFKATEEQIFALTQLYSSNGLGRTGASPSSQQVTDQIFSAFPNFQQPPAPGVVGGGLQGAVSGLGF